MEYWVGRYQAVAAERGLEAWLRTLRRGEAAAATHWHDFGSSSAVVHDFLFYPLCPFFSFLFFSAALPLLLFSVFLSFSFVFFSSFFLFLSFVLFSSCFLSDSCLVGLVLFLLFLFLVFLLVGGVDAVGLVELDSVDADDGLVLEDVGVDAGSALAFVDLLAFFLFFFFSSFSLSPSSFSRQMLLMLILFIVG